MAPPTIIAPANTNGNSMAIANCCEKLRACFAAGEVSGVLLSSLSEGIARQPRERLRIQPRRKSHKQGDAKRHGLRAAHRWSGRFAGLGQPGMQNHAEVIVK